MKFMVNVCQTPKYLQMFVVIFFLAFPHTSGGRNSLGLHVHYLHQRPSLHCLPSVHFSTSLLQSIVARLSTVLVLMNLQTRANCTSPAHFCSSCRSTSNSHVTAGCHGRNFFLTRGWCTSIVRTRKVTHSGESAREWPIRRLD